MEKCNYSCLPNISKDSRLAKIWRLVVQIVLHIASILVFVLVVPIFLVLTFPLYVYRVLIKVLAKIRRQDLGKMVVTRSALFAADEIYAQPLLTNVARFILDGECDLQRLVNLVDANWLQSTVSHGNDFKYPELKQYITVWNGFHFWKNDDHFSVHNHVKLYANKKPGNFVLLDEVNEFWNEMSMKPFDKNRSPWEIIVIPFFQDGINLDTVSMSSLSSENSKSVIIFRWHHALCDGFSVMNLLSLIGPINLDTVAKPAASTENGSPKDWWWWWDRMVYACRTPYLLIRLLFTPADKNPWHLPAEKLTKYWHLGVGDGIPIQIVYDIKTGLDVKFTSVLLAGVTAALRQMMLKESENGQNGKIIPKYITCGLPFPVANHPQKLRNHWAICTVLLPVGEENPFKRLRLINEHVMELQQSCVPSLSYHVAPFIGALPAPIVKKISANRVSSAVCSIMPGPPEILHNFLGNSVLDAMYINSCGPGRNGIAFAALTFSGWVKFSVTVDSAFSPHPTLANELIKGVQDELQYLQDTMASKLTA